MRLSCVAHRVCLDVQVEWWISPWAWIISNWCSVHLRASIAANQLSLIPACTYNTFGRDPMWTTAQVKIPDNPPWRWKRKEARRFMHLFFELWLADLMEWIRYYWTMCSLGKGANLQVALQQRTEDTSIIVFFLRVNLNLWSDFAAVWLQSMRFW